MESKLNEQWVENGRMYKAVEGPKIVNGLMEGNTCHGCCYVDKWDDDCLNPNQACPVGKGVIIKDLGPVNGEGVLGCPYCGKPLEIIDTSRGFGFRCYECGIGTVEDNWTKEAVIEIANRRA